MKVFFCSSEVFPFSKTGGLADVCGTLPLALEELGIEVAVSLPRYRCIDPKKYKLKKINHEISVGKLGKNIPVYFIEDELFFNRSGLYGDAYGDYRDNFDRFLFYNQRTLDLLGEIDFKADIIHCHDWQTGLIPVYLRSVLRDHPFYTKMKSILTIHNMAFQGVFPAYEYPKLNLDHRLFGIDGLEFYGHINFLKGGIIFSDVVTTVSPQYSKEIQTKEYGCGLEGVLRYKRKSVVGILNGLDYDFWNPQTDPYLVKKFSPRNLQNKYLSKVWLQEECHLSPREDVPVFGMVARLSAQKGLDLITEAMAELIHLDLQLVILGTGDEKYQKTLKSMAHKHPQKMSVYFDFDEGFAHRIYAGSDIFLMPSHYEPCGLSQMISLRYGTIPLVFKTGGLADTIIPFDSPDGKGNGFVFHHYDKRSFLKTVEQAMKVYHQRPVFEGLVRRAFKFNFSWETAAKKYKQLYRQCLSSA